MRAFVNENCIGCGMCHEVCPDVFSMLDGDRAVAVDAEVNNSDDSVEIAADGCPVSAIEITY